MLPFNRILVLIIFFGISILVLQYSFDTRTHVRPKLQRKLATNFRKQQAATVTAVDPDGLSCVQTATDFPAYVCLHEDVEDSFSRCMRINGKWEAWIVNHMVHVLKQYPDMGVIDMGANVGMYAMTAAAMGRHVIAIEPRDDNVLRLRRAALLNHAEDRTVILQNVVGGSHYEAQFMQQPNPVQGRVWNYELSRVWNYYFGRVWRYVTSVTPDDLLQHAKFKKAFVKIDIEGKETEALVEGGNKLFNEMEIPIVTLEWGWLGKNSKKSTLLASFFLDRGYLPFSHHGEDFRHVNKSEWTWDMWFIHPSCPDCMLPTTYVGPPPSPDIFPPRC